MRRASSFAVVALIALVCGLGFAREPSRRFGRSAIKATVAVARTAIWAIRYRTHDGLLRAAYVLAPSWYGPAHDPALPLIISPHGRGEGGRENAQRWGDLPGAGRFLVVSPDGQGRRLSSYSWGYSGQISDLARMPAIVTRQLPWVHIARRAVFVFGGSMGGQEALLLAARFPHLLAGVAAFDSVSDLALQYRSFPSLGCNRACLASWGEPIGIAVQTLARREMGGSPQQLPHAYALRSPLTYARALSDSGVPIELWWSARDRVVPQAGQSQRLFGAIRRFNRDAPLEAYVGWWAHTDEMRPRSALPLALQAFALLRPGRFGRIPALREREPPSSWPWPSPTDLDG
jgi:pimeloyl-ACP methyl ester carboxylesterase